MLYDFCPKLLVADTSIYFSRRALSSVVSLTECKIVTADTLDQLGPKTTNDVFC